MKITLSALDGPEGLYLANAWKKACGDLDFVQFHRGSILDVNCDAVVSPANSFGFMDGGIDALYTKHFGPDVQTHLQTLIKINLQGELLVGTAEVIPTFNKKIPYLIAAPTMRVPMIIKDTINPYLAARAALRVAVNMDFKHVAFPGLGTGVGRVDPDICARHMRAAIDHVLLRKLLFPTSWVDASKQHQRLSSDATRDLQFEPGTMGHRYGDLNDEMGLR